MKKIDDVSVSRHSTAMKRFFFLSHKDRAVKKAGRKLLEHYRKGDSPEKTVAESFNNDSPNELKKGLRELVEDQAYELRRIGYYEVSLSSYSPLPKRWPTPLQQHLDIQEVALRPFDSRRNRYPGLSNTEFYRQAVALAFTLAEHGSAYLTNGKEYDLLDDLQQNHPTVLQAMEERLQQQQHDKTYLHCDLPPDYLNYLEWLQQRSR